MKRFLIAKFDSLLLTRPLGGGWNGLRMASFGG